MWKRMDTHKLVVFGPGGVGKTSLTIQMCLRKFEQYDPTIEDTYRTQVVVDKRLCVLEILDTAGQEECRVVPREPCIREGQGFIFVYDITSRWSFDDVIHFHRQVQRVREAAQNSLRTAPMTLVGNKYDRVSDREVSTEEGQTLAQEIGCEFIETSAKYGHNVEQLFHDLVREVRRQREPANPSTPEHGQASVSKLLSHFSRNSRAPDIQTNALVAFPEKAPQIELSPTEDFMSMIERALLALGILSPASKAP